MNTSAYRLAVVVVALLATACSVTGTGDPSVAAVVGDQTITAADVDDSLEAIQRSPAFQQQAQGDVSGEVVLDARNQVVTTFVRSEILTIVAERNGIEVSDEEVAQARDELVTSLGGEETYEQRLAEQGLSDEFVRQQLRDRRASELLVAQLGPAGDLEQYIRDEISDVPIEVNPRYGQWNAGSLLVVPYDPLAAEAAPGDVTPPNDDGGAAGDGTDDGDGGDE